MSRLFRGLGRSHFGHYHSTTRYTAQAFKSSYSTRTVRPTTITRRALQPDAGRHHVEQFSEGRKAGVADESMCILSHCFAFPPARPPSRVDHVRTCGCAAIAALAGGLFVAARPFRATTELLPPDLDALQNSMSSACQRAAAALRRLRAGAHGWRRSERAPASLQERVDRIAPTWKPGGHDYAWSTEPSAATLAPCRVQLAPLAVPGAGTKCRSAAPSSASAFAPPTTTSRAALREMSWRYTPGSTGAAADAARALLDATPACRALDDCPTPGPARAARRDGLPVRAAAHRDFGRRRSWRSGRWRRP